MLYDFTRMADTKACCAYCQRVALELFLREFWPLDFFIHITSMDIFCEQNISANLRQNVI